MTSTTTTRHTDATRAAILDGAVDLFLERRGGDFSVQEVADRAGLTHRTVYRYFPTRGELLGAASQRLAVGVDEQSFTEVSTVEEWIDAVAGHFAHTEANLELVRRVVSTVLGSPEILLFQERDAHFWEVFRRQFRNLPERDASRIFATLRHLMSSTSYVIYRLRFGLSPADATEAIQVAASVIAAQAARSDQASAPPRRD
ncbi:helix-turn-helix domain-containing protein [Agromyces neolithicus]|uniref:HTH tetR-type domain-containing protein n=1 Tax=Agromyces neolithicus TaxID=269420 RepID=A0ABN2LYN1_9MICO